MRIGKGMAQAAEAAAVPTMSAAEGELAPENVPLLSGAALSVVMKSGGPNGPTVPERTAVLLSIMNAQYKVLSIIAKNMGVSEKERELRERHKQDLKAKIDELERRKDMTEQELIDIANTLAAAEDRQLLDAQMEENRLKG